MSAAAGGAAAQLRAVRSWCPTPCPGPCLHPRLSCRKENNGNDPSVNLINKGTGWGAGAGAAGGGGSADDAGAGKHHERAIPAQPAPAWGGAGLPEERKKQVGAHGGGQAGRRAACRATHTLQIKEEGRCWMAPATAAATAATAPAARLPGAAPTSLGLPLIHTHNSWRWPASKSSRCWAMSGEAGRAADRTTPRRTCGLRATPTTRTAGLGTPTSAALQVGGQGQTRG